VRERARARVRMYVCACVRDEAFEGCRGNEEDPNRGREKLALEYLKARRSGSQRDEMGANAAQE